MGDGGRTHRTQKWAKRLAPTPWRHWWRNWWRPEESTYLGRSNCCALFQTLEGPPASLVGDTTSPSLSPFSDLTASRSLVRIHVVTPCCRSAHVMNFCMHRRFCVQTCTQLYVHAVGWGS